MANNSGLVKIVGKNGRTYILNIVFISYLTYFSNENERHTNTIMLLTGEKIEVDNEELNKVLTAFGESNETLG